jgi:hypothetical protein
MITTAFGRHFFERLPRIVQDDIQFNIKKRKRRGGATSKNLERFEIDAVRHGLKYSPYIENKYPFVDSRNNAIEPPRIHSSASETIELNHYTLMSDERLERLAFNLTENFTRIIQEISIEEHETGYFDALRQAFFRMSEIMRTVFIKPPSVKNKHKIIADGERELERAIRRLLDVDYLVRKFQFLRSQYIEYSQIALNRVGEQKGQRQYVSARSFSRWRKKQAQAKQFLESMAVFNDETGESFDLAEVAKRTTANPENRRIELVVRSRGDEERAIDLGYEGIFITWTLPSKYHRKSSKWSGCTPKEGHQNIMEQWKLARAWFKKLDIDWFGLRVAEPHKDGTPHAHLFLYVNPEQKEQMVQVIEQIAISEDKDELLNKDGELEKSRRIQFEYCDPAKGTATGYIIKYISKNINGAHMPEDDAQESAFSAQAWASTHRIKQFSQSGAPAVGLWRQLRRANATETAFDEELEALRGHADNSRWKGFCELGFKAKLAYEEKFNKYGDSVKRVIGLDWLGKVIETCATKYSLIKKKDAKRKALALKSGGAAPWSTENKCNPITEKPILPIEKALMDVTGWSVKGVQCLIPPLLRGAKVAIDKYSTISLANNRLLVK